jgi:hypothetical protein
MQYLAAFVTRVLDGASFTGSELIFSETAGIRWLVLWPRVSRFTASTGTWR